MRPAMRLRVDPNPHGGSEVLRCVARSMPALPESGTRAGGIAGRDVDAIVLAPRKG
ncbi:hypothetical protein NXT3_CH02240 [Sinorhizobium fredii]|uniref:Uncharacterized protein n=1 Tax=Rhizobium fredii TaxID=380 RepID=A0A2L0H5P8_RHIFR|nr:hypothetical protein NXT3_CH02240 [Sinorhizobium fredii]